MARNLRVALCMLTLAFALLAVSPGLQSVAADCVGFVSGIYLIPCAKCVGTGGFGACLGIFADGDCSCVNVGSGCISGGGSCDFIIGDI